MQEKHLTLDRAAELLRKSREGILDAVVTGDLPCGIIAPGWYGIALPSVPDPAPNEPGIVWRGEVVKPGQTTRDTLYRYWSDQGHDLSIFGCGVGGFWYLDHSDAHDIVTRGMHAVTWLIPEDGPSMHAADPTRFPADDFSVTLFEDNGLSRSIGIEKLRFHVSDLKPGPRPTAERANDMAIEIDSAVKEIERAGATPSPALVMRQLQARAGEKFTCITEAVDEGVLWRHGSTGQLTKLTMAALKERLKRRKAR